MASERLSRAAGPNLKSAPSTAVNPFRSAAPPTQKIALENLFAFKRGRGDLLLSALLALFALFVLLTFNHESMFEHRALPGSDAKQDFTFGEYVRYEAANVPHMALGAARAFSRGEPLGTRARKRAGLKAIERLDWPHESRRPRFGKTILKSPWAMPLAFVTLLIPAALLNLWASWRAAKRTQKLRRPNKTVFEVKQWARALEFVAYFVAYTFLVPVLGYLIATVAMTVLLPLRLGYRSRRWVLISIASGLAIVLLFKTGLRINTPTNIWLYSLLPTELSSFMRTYF